MATPYAKLFVSLNSGALQDGGVPAALSDTVDLSAESTVGWPASGVGAPKWEIYGYPPSFTVPAGWSTDGTTNAYYYTGVTPPQFTLTHWGKYMLRLTVQGGGGDKTDESTAISVEDASGLVDLGKYETNQFNPGWDDDHRANLRVIATGLGIAKAPADAQYLVGAANGDLSAEVVWTSIGTTVAFASTATQPCTFSRTDSGTTNTALTARTLIALGGTVANGFGVQEVYQAEGAGGTAIDAGSVGFTWVDITGGSEDSKCTIGVRTGGASLASCAEFSGSGSTLIRHAATTNDTLPLLTLRRTTSDAGFGATGIGGSVVFELEDGAGNTDTAATLAVDYLDATSTSEDARWLFRGQVAGSLTDLLSLRGQTMRIHGLAGSGTGVVAVDNNGDLSYVAAAAGTANFLEDTATAVTTNGRPIQNLAAQLSFLRAAEAPVKLTHQAAAAGSVVEGLRIRQFIAASGVGTGTEGVRIAFSLPNGSGTETVAGTARYEWTTVIGGGTSKFVVAPATAGSLNDRFVVEGSGTITASGYAAAGMLTNNASGVFSSSNPAILVHGTVPANVSNGLNTQALGGTAVLFQANAIEPIWASRTDASDNTVLDGLCVQRVPDGGNGATGIGTGIVIRTMDDGAGQIDIGRLTWTTTNVTGAGFASTLGVCTAASGSLVEVLTLTGVGSLAFTSTMTPAISQTKRSGTGANDGTALAISAQQGQDVAGGTNNDGGNLELASGAVGTGGTGGTNGDLVLKTGSTPRLTLEGDGSDALFATATTTHVVERSVPYNGGDATGAVTLDFSQSNKIEVSALVDNVTFTITGAVVGARYSVIARQHASSAKTTTWSSGLFASGDDAIGTTVNTYTAWQFEIMTGGTIVCVGVKKDIVIP